MSFWLDPELQRYFNIDAAGAPPPLRQMTQQQQQQQQLQPQESPPTSTAAPKPTLEQLKASVMAALAEDAALSFLLRLDSVVGCRDGVITCLTTVRRNVHHQELQYLQRFKQIAEPSIRHPPASEQMLLCLDPRTLRCGQQVLLKVQTRAHPTAPLQLLREWSILRAKQDPAAFPKAYLFGCLGYESWQIKSEDSNDQRELVIYRQHFLLCQHVDDSLQRTISTHRVVGESLDALTLIRLCREMLNRLGQLHGLGWSHGCLQPSSFVIQSGGDELLLADFASAEPLLRDCLVYPGQRERSSIYGAVRFSADSKLEAAYSDLESLVYIVCSLAALPKPPPWESMTPESMAGFKTAFWQFVEADEADPIRSDLWSQWHLDDAFYCSERSAVAESIVYRLASGIHRLHFDRSGTEPPSCPALVDSLR